MENEKAKLLFIDDEKEFLDICRKYFEMKNFKVYTANSGNLGLEIIKSEKPDLIVLDIRMPELSGIEVLSQIRAFNKDSKIIVLSGFGTAENVRHASELGISDFINKPFVLNTLLNIIQEALIGTKV